MELDFIKSWVTVVDFSCSESLRNIYKKVSVGLRAKCIASNIAVARITGPNRNVLKSLLDKIVAEYFLFTSFVNIFIFFKKKNKTFFNCLHFLLSKVVKLKIACQTTRTATRSSFRNCKNISFHIETTRYSLFETMLSALIIVILVCSYMFACIVHTYTAGYTHTANVYFQTFFVLK